MTEQNKKFEPTENGLNADRVVYGGSRKVSDGNYGSYDFHCSLSSDVRPGETVGEAVKRSIVFVEKVLEFKIQQCKQGQLKF